MTRKAGKSLRFSYYETEAEKYQKRKEKTDSKKSKSFATGVRFPMGGYLVVDEKGNVYFGKSDPLTKKILSVCMIETAKKQEEIV